MTEHNESESRNLFLYFVVAIDFTWLFWILEALAMRGRLGSSILVDFLLSPHNPAAWGSLVAAFSLTYLNEGIDGVKKFVETGCELSVWEDLVAPHIPSLACNDGGCPLIINTY